MKKNLFIFFCLCIVSSYGQDTLVKKWKLNLQLDNRFSSINDKNITLFGFKAGLQYKNLTRFGIGMSTVLKPISVEYYNKDTNLNETNTMNFWYVSVFNDWIFFRSKHWQCFITEQFGVGRPNFTREVNNEVVSDMDVTIFLNEISVQAQYKILPWIGAGAGIGYRNSLNKSNALKSTINAPIYILKVIIYPKAIIGKNATFFKRKKR